jgi:hypothetical protein
VAELGGANQRNHSRAMERILRVKEIENLGLQDIHLLHNIVGNSCNLIMHLSLVDAERWNCLVKTTEQFQEINFIKWISVQQFNKYDQNQYVPSFKQ